MSFGKNPHVAKAQTAEQKAADAIDAPARAQSYRDAAHQWDRAAARETKGKRRDEYERRAEHNRELADPDRSAPNVAETHAMQAVRARATVLN